MRKNRRWTMEQKRQAVDRMVSCRHEQVAAEIGIPKRQLYMWRREVWEKDHPRESGSARERALERENQRLKEALATISHVVTARSGLDIDRFPQLRRL